MIDSLAFKYGLSRSVKLEQITDNHIGIVRRIKSRIIQKDALRIIEIADAIRLKDSNIKVSLICSPNICSKSLSLLKESGVEVIFD